MPPLWVTPAKGAPRGCARRPGATGQAPRPLQQRRGLAAPEGGPPARPCRFRAPPEETGRGVPLEAFENMCELSSQLCPGGGKGLGGKYYVLDSPQTRSQKQVVFRGSAQLGENYWKLRVDRTMSNYCRTGVELTSNNVESISKSCRTNVEQCRIRVELMSYNVE